MDALVRKLFTQVLRVRKNAHAPISHFKVGAAVLTKSSNVFAACNVESPTLTLTTHAEMAAIDRAVAAGERHLAAILVVTGCGKPVYPCALCLQKIADFSRSTVLIYAATVSGIVRHKTLQELYPEAFTARALRNEK